MENMVMHNVKIVGLTRHHGVRAVAVPNAL